MIRAVLDTNVIVSSFLNPHGTPSRVREAWRTDRFELCLSNPLLIEIQDVLRRPVISRATKVSPEEINAFVKRLKRAAYFVEEPFPIEPVILADPDDDVVLATAVAAAADFIVSGDRHLLDLLEYDRVSVISPARFLEVLSDWGGP